MMSDSTRTQAISAIASLPVGGANESAPVSIDYYGADVFSTEVMKKYLPKDTAKTLLATIQDGLPLNADIAADVAHAMKQWALERGATHYTHWFQPMTGSTAEKHDSFLDPKGMEPIMSFSGKNLIVSEPDASSFPSGGLRCTFEARGYTAWDPTSPAFIKRHGNGATLCIPTAYCSYTGDALDKKTPLLRSRQALGNAVKKLMKSFGLPDEHVTITLGPEQEYFLIDKNFYLNRPDLVQTGRTLFGAPPAKHQQLEDHYFGSIKPRILNFMSDVEQELWRLGIPAKTRHNEVAPAQFELAPLFEDVNLAIDHNMLVMEVLRQQASKHGLVCLLHEKPFAGVNGSGKHNNWSISYGNKNLLDPGSDPQQNAIFLTVLTAIIEAVDKHSDLLRNSVASAGNDHRLGANEAPPAVVSIFLGDELSAVLEAIETDTPYEGTEKTQMKLGADVLPKFNRDTTDRNRTSPFAFTGNKFEFRMLGSSNSIACANIMLNTAVAESLRIYADRLEGAEDFETALHEMIRKTIKDHKRIIFNGNGYEENWIREATEKRGLLNYRTTADAVPHILDKKNVDMLTSHGVFTEAEIRSRYEITLENYCKTIIIEANTMVDMAKTQIAPAVSAYASELARTSAAKKALDSALPCGYETDLVRKLSALTDRIYDGAVAVENSLLSLAAAEDIGEEAALIRDQVLAGMGELRVACDEAETLTAKRYWPYPSYGDLLFSVQ